VAVTALGRVCTRCHEWKTADHFRANSNNKTSGLYSYCNPCERARGLARHKANPDAQRWRTVRHRYGLEKADYDRMLEEQGGACASCGTTESSHDHPRRNALSEHYWLHIDHDHETGEIRGLLCYRCNNGIGLLGSPKALRQAADYLERRQVSDLSQ
jgi:hypothetical protein